ncbi:hypothetical protein B8W73_14230 [Arthrobacter agilis]|nr:hypothetical protein B8W73_14230 [Arthrobacter agilis]
MTGASVATGPMAPCATGEQASSNAAWWPGSAEELSHTAGTAVIPKRVCSRNCPAPMASSDERRESVRRPSSVIGTRRSTPNRSRTPGAGRWPSARTCDADETDRTSETRTRDRR